MTHNCASSSNLLRMDDCQGLMISPFVLVALRYGENVKKSTSAHKLAFHHCTHFHRRVDADDPSHNVHFLGKIMKSVPG